MVTWTVACVVPWKTLSAQQAAHAQPQTREKSLSRSEDGPRRLSQIGRKTLDTQKASPPPSSPPPATHGQVCRMHRLRPPLPHSLRRPQSVLSPVLDSDTDLPCGHASGMDRMGVPPPEDEMTMTKFGRPILTLKKNAFAHPSPRTSSRSAHSADRFHGPHDTFQTKFFFEILDHSWPFRSNRFCPLPRPNPPPNRLPDCQTRLSNHFSPPPPCVTFRLVVAPLRGPGQSPVLPFACCVGLLLSVGRCGRCSCWCRFRVRGAQWSVCWDCVGCGRMCRLRVSGAQ